MAENGPQRDVSHRGVKKMTDFLRIELDEPDLPESRVAAWVRSGKIEVSRFGRRNVIATSTQLRRSIGKE